MANYLCEEIPSCTSFQSAICLHCNHRLCLFHIGEHNKTILSDVQNLSDEAQATASLVKEDCERNTSAYNNILVTLNQWRIEQIGKIEHMYQDQVQCVTIEQQTLEQLGHELLKKLENDVLQQVRLLQSQAHASMGVVNLIRQTIDQVQEDSKHLKWTFSSPPIITIESSRSTSIQQSRTDTNTSITKKSSTTNAKVSKNNRPYRRLIPMFANTSSIKKGRHLIDAYIQSQGQNIKLANIISSYLTAWFEKSNVDKKVYLLNGHIATIQYYLIKRNSDLDVLFGIQGFFHNIKISKQTYKRASIFVVKNDHSDSPAAEMMTFLLQFFLHHQCINESLILSWYNHRGTISSQGYKLAKQLAKSFVQSISISNTVNNVQEDSNTHIRPEQPTST